MRLESEAATEALARSLGARLEVGDLIGLEGPLGAGKTAFVRGLATGMGISSGLVHSPTYVLHHVYSGGRILLHHVDCYRLGPAADLGVVDIETLLETGAVALEWSDYADLAEFRTVRIRITIAGPGTRLIEMAEDAPGRLRRVWDEYR